MFGGYHRSSCYLHQANTLTRRKMTLLLSRLYKVRKLLSSMYSIVLFEPYLYFVATDGPHLRTVSCGKPGDCNHVDGTYCDADAGLCLCKPDYPVTDSHHCYKGEESFTKSQIDMYSSFSLYFLPHCYAHRVQVR